MIILLLLAFNWLLLFIITGMIIGLFFTQLPYPDVFAGSISFLIVLGLTFLFQSSAGEFLIRLVSGARRAIVREKNQINPLIDQVQESIYQKMGLSPLPIKLMILDDPVPNAMAIGRSTLVLTRSLYEQASQEELMGVIAHEFGHLHNKDSQKLAVAVGVSLTSIVVSFIAGVICSISGRINSNTASSETGIFIKAISLFVMLMSAFFLLFTWMGNGIFRLIMLFQGRKQEYGADKFAVEIGFGKGLLSFLDRIKEYEYQKKKSFITRLYESHPPMMYRIEKIEEQMSQTESAGLEAA